MNRSQRGNSESRFDRLAFWLGAVIVSWLASVVVTQSYYWIVPAKPSAVALRLEAEAAQRLFVFENGYRLAGWLAPIDSDPMGIGRCAYPDMEARAQAIKAGAEPAYTTLEQEKARLGVCLNGVPPISLGQPIADAKALPTWRLEDWLSLGREVPAPALLDRAQTIWSHGHTRLGIDSNRPTPDPKPLHQLAQWQMASAALQWQNGKHSESMKTWAAVAGQTMGATGDDLVETMRSTATLSRWLLSLQSALGSTQILDATTAHQAMAMLTAIDSLPQAGYRSMISEWQSTALTIGNVATSVKAQWKEKTNAGNQTAFFWLNGLFAAIYDPVDTVNLYSQDFEGHRSNLLIAAQGLPTTEVVSRRSCTWLGAIGAVCLPYERNVIGKWVAGAGSSYDRYGTRIADLRNLAAATRLTIEARRQGLQGEALARFVAEAPENMRDIFSKAPFAYDPSQRQLTIQLREKSTVLGKGSYTVPL